jgi:16S rRNA (guanine527-N7)-methyltransferase
LGTASPQYRAYPLARAVFFCYSFTMDQDILLLQKNAKTLNIELNERQLVLFDIYKNELLHWNAKTNLISENSSREIVARHFLDSLTALQFIPKTDARVLDIGCGAGFPGIPIKIALPDLEIYLLEANRKKVSFLKHIIRLLKLSRTFVLHDRVEHVIQTDVWKEKFDIVISRATFKLSELLPLGNFFLTQEGQLIALKGPSVDDEIKRYSMDTNPCKISQLIQYDMKALLGDASRKIIIVKK